MAITTTPSGGPQGEFSTYTPIYSQTLSSAAASITFSNIPTTFTDLVIIANFNTATGNQSTNITVNGDTSSNYSWTYILGNGSAASSSRGSSDSRIFNGSSATATSGNTTNSTIQFQNYSNATTYKTIISRSNAADYFTQATVGLWRSTSPITSITLTCPSYNYTSGSTFTLYGIKAAVSAPKATGGDQVYTDGTYWYHIFNSSGIFDAKQSLTADFLVLAGGGSGAGYSDASGGGGAGGYRTSVGTSGRGASAESQLSLNPVQYPIIVGAGAPSYGITVTYDSFGYNGSNSSFSTITSIGGGGGGKAYGYAGLNGGAGGGGGWGAPQQGGGLGTTGQGYDGGAGSDYNGYNGGGGGGVGAPGNSPNSSPYNSNGGAGLTSTISGFSVTRGGGGGGGRASAGAGIASGGAGGGGNGGNPANRPTAGATNTGGGGGGSRTDAGWNSYAQTGAGGSGVVIVRYTV
jgi:hypothetical protein